VTVVTNPQTGEIIPTAKGRNKVGAQNFQCPVCKNIEKCKSIYTEELWDDDGSCSEFLYDERTSKSNYPPHVI